jgi:phytoene dehydrogenase-like protein
MTRSFDAIVVGSGLGGLTAGVLYARTGHRVLLLERNDHFGGAATVYRHDGLAVEASLHEMDGLDDGDPKSPLFSSLGLERLVQFVDVGDLYQVRSPLLGEPFVLPHGMEAACSALTARFPQHEGALREYLDRISAVREAVRFAGIHQDEAGWWVRHAPEAVRRVWPLLREGRATVSEVLADLFGSDEGVKLAVAANLSYYHDDPDRMSFLSYAVPQASYLAGGGHYVRGGSVALTNALLGLLREAGGIAESGREVDSLLANLTGVSGVRHRPRNGGQPVFDDAPLVFGNAAPHRLAGMLPHSVQSQFFAPYVHRRPSVSLWTVSLGLRRPPAEFGVRHYATFVLPEWMRTLSSMRESTNIMAHATGERLPAYTFVDYHQIDSGLNSEGLYLASFCGTDRVENWAGLEERQVTERKQRWMDRLVADLDRQFPGIAGTVVHREMATAVTLAHYLNTPGGAAYGFAPEGSLADTFRLSPRTAIHGLLLASAYTFGGGFTGAMLGGAEAARQALKGAP